MAFFQQLIVNPYLTKNIKLTRPQREAMHLSIAQSFSLQGCAFFTVIITSCFFNNNMTPSQKDADTRTTGGGAQYLVNATARSQWIVHWV